MILIRDPLPLLGATAIVVVGKSLAAMAIMAAFKQPRSSSALIASSLAQIGEFSFILASLGVGLGLLPEQGRDLILGAAILSIIINPLVFFAADRWAPHPVAPTSPAPQIQPSVHRAVLIGHGRVGSMLASELRRLGLSYTVIEEKVDLTDALTADGVGAINANAVSPEALKEAGIENAQLLYLTVPDGFEAGRIVEAARKINPDIRIFARAHSEAEVEHLKRFGANMVISGEWEIAQAMADATRPLIKALPVESAA